MQLNQSGEQINRQTFTTPIGQPTFCVIICTRICNIRIYALSGLVGLINAFTEIVHRICIAFASVYDSKYSMGQIMFCSCCFDDLHRCFDTSLQDYGYTKSLFLLIASSKTRIQRSQVFVHLYSILLVLFILSQQL